jgi:hypothetical protein
VSAFPTFEVLGAWEAVYVVWRELERSAVFGVG